MTTEDEMGTSLYDYSLIQQHIEDLRRDAEKARLVRGARRNRRNRRQRRHELSAGGTLRTLQAR